METKIVYSYNQSGLYIGIVTLDNTDRDPYGNWNIPSGCTEVKPDLKTGYNSYFVNGSWTYVAQTYNVLCYYNYGMSSREVLNTYVPIAGEILFNTIPNDSDLAVSFPSIASSIIHTVTENATIGSTVEIQGVVLTATSSTTDISNFAIGTTIAETIANIVASMRLNKKITQLWNVTSTDTAIILTEKIPGNKSTPVNIITSGSVSISSGTPIVSTYGYKNAVMSQQLSLLTSTYVSKLTEVKRGLLDAYTLNNTNSVAALKLLRESVVSEYNTKAQAIING